MNPDSSCCVWLQVTGHHRWPSLITQHHNCCIYAFCIPLLSHCSFWEHVHIPKASLTIDNHSCCGAFSFGHNVFGDTSVIGCVRKPGLLNDQVVIDGDVKISVFHGINHLFVLQPLHLRVWNSQRGSGESSPGHTTMGTVSVVTLLTPESAMSQGTSWRTHLRCATSWNKIPWQKLGRTPFMPNLSFSSHSLPLVHTTAVFPCLESINAFSNAASYGVGTKSWSMFSESEARDKDCICKQTIPLQHQKPYDRRDLT